MTIDSVNPAPGFLDSETFASGYLQIYIAPIGGPTGLEAGSEIARVPQARPLRSGRNAVGPTEGGRRGGPGQRAMRSSGKMPVRRGMRWPRSRQGVAMGVLSPATPERFLAGCRARFLSPESRGTSRSFYRKFVAKLWSIFGSPTLRGVEARCLVPDFATRRCHCGAIAEKNGSSEMRNE